MSVYRAAQEASVPCCEYIERKNNSVIFAYTYVYSFALLQQNWMIFAVEMLSTINTPTFQILSKLCKVFPIYVLSKIV